MSSGIRGSSKSNSTGCQICQTAKWHGWFGWLNFRVTLYFSYPCIVLLFTLYCISSVPSSDLLTKSIMDVIWQPSKFDSLLNWIWKSPLCPQCIRMGMLWYTAVYSLYLLGKCTKFLNCPQGRSQVTFEQPNRASPVSGVVLFMSAQPTYSAQLLVLKLWRKFSH